jgi:hypothetical protein
VVAVVLRACAASLVALMSDMAFSLTLLKRFAATGEVQYRFCP